MHLNWWWWLRYFILHAPGSDHLHLLGHKKRFWTKINHLLCLFDLLNNWRSSKTFMNAKISNKIHKFIKITRKKIIYYYYLPLYSLKYLPFIHLSAKFSFFVRLLYFNWIKMYTNAIQFQTNMKTKRNFIKVL